METMHLVLPVGAFDWAGNPMSDQDFHDRLIDIRNLMTERNWSGVVVFGDIPDPGLLTYVSNFAPRLSPAFALIPRHGDPRIITLVGGRMVPAGKLTTWIDDVRSAPDIGQALTEWLGEIGNGAPLGLAGFDAMPAEVHDKIASIGAIAAGDDATRALRQISRRKQPAELAILKDNCRLLDQVAAIACSRHDDGKSLDEAVTAAEGEARQLGAQDARCLYSPDGGQTFIPFQQLSDGRVDPAIFYLAVKRFGYWADGFVTAGGLNATQALARTVLDGLVAEVKPGATGATICDARDRVAAGATCHAILGADAGAGIGIGVSLEETPLLDRVSGDELAEDDVVSIKVGLAGAGGGNGFASAILHVRASENDILWKSP